MLRLESTLPTPPTPVDVKPTNPRTSRLGPVAWPSGSESPACPVAALWTHHPSPRRSSLLLVIPQVWNGTCNSPLTAPSKEHHPPSLSHYPKATSHPLAVWTLRFTCVSQTGCNNTFHTHLCRACAKLWVQPPITQGNDPPEKEEGIGRSSPWLLSHGRLGLG